MSNSVHSEKFYYEIAFSKADSNKDGILDENEKSIFLNEMKKFDANNDGVINEEDYKINKESMLITDEEQNLSKQYEDYAKNNPMDEQNASKHIELLEKVNPMKFVEKRVKNENFRNDIINLVNYWKETGAFDKINSWYDAIEKWLKGE